MTFMAGVDKAAIPDDVSRFRERMRATKFPRRYSGYAHFAFTSIVSIIIISYSLFTLSSLRPLELLTIPITFLFANIVEYRAHKGVMHFRRRGFSLVFERHTPSHHGFYTHEAMAAESPDDFYMVLFPPILIVFFFGLFALPVGFLLAWLTNANIARLFVATAVGYYLTYEWLHFSYHLPAQSFVGRLGIVRRLRAHHTAHHDRALMQKHNFNITFPICDALFGTTFRPPPGDND
jgi:hypothetical protein